MNFCHHKNVASAAKAIDIDEIADKPSTTTI
jgi:hypothetical protein